MTMAEQRILKTIDGFFVGRILRNGEMSKDAYHLSDADIVAMFEDYLRRYCSRNDDNVLMVYRKGLMTFEALLHDDNGKFVPKKKE